jgi:hypothetical protein
MSSSFFTNSNNISNINSNSNNTKIRNKSTSNKLTISYLINNNILTNSNNNDNNIIKSYKDKNKNININTIFSLPNIKKKIFKQNSYKFLGNNSARKIENIEKNPLFKNLNNNFYSDLNINTINNKIIENNETINNKELERFMKEKYYEDIEKLTINKLLKKNWFSGTKTQNQVLKIHKVANFWKGICDYSIPHLNVEKFKIKKELKKEKKLNLKSQFNKFNKIEKKDKKLPNLFTSDVLSDIRHKLRIKNEKKFYERLNKIEELRNIKITLI